MPALKWTDVRQIAIELAEKLKDPEWAPDYGRPVFNSKNIAPARISFRPGVASAQPDALSGSNSQAGV